MHKADLIIMDEPTVGIDPQSSITVYFIIALFIARWTPLTIPAILLGFLGFIFIYALFWIGYYLYYKKVEESMNANLPKKD